MNRAAPTSTIGLRIAAGLLAVVLLMALPKAAQAEYQVVGAIEGQSCIYYGALWNCTTGITVDAVEGSDGKLYELPSEYSDVSDYDEAVGMCLIRLASILPDPIGWLLERALNPRYFEKLPDGMYQLVDIDSLQFRCVKPEEDIIP